MAFVCGVASDSIAPLRSQVKSQSLLLYNRILLTRRPLSAFRLPWWSSELVQAYCLDRISAAAEIRLAGRQWFLTTGSPDE